MTNSDYMRATALSLRDLAESCGATNATFTLETAVLTWDVDDGFDLLLPDGNTVDLDEWVDRVDFVPVEGVESVSEQPALLARGSA